MGQSAELRLSAKGGIASKWTMGRCFKSKLSYNIRMHLTGRGKKRSMRHTRVIVTH